MSTEAKNKVENGKGLSEDKQVNEKQKVCMDKDDNGEVIQALHRMSAIAREIFALMEQEVPTMRKS